MQIALALQLINQYTPRNYYDYGALTKEEIEEQKSFAQYVHEIFLLNYSVCVYMYATQPYQSAL